MVRGLSSYLMTNTNDTGLQEKSALAQSMGSRHAHSTNIYIQAKHSHKIHVKKKNTKTETTCILFPVTQLPRPVNKGTHCQV